MQRLEKFSGEFVSGVSVIDSGIFQDMWKQPHGITRAKYPLKTKLG